MRRVLITGFGPFGGVASNPTDAGVRLAAQRLRASGVDVVDEVLPVSFERAGRRRPSGWTPHRRTGRSP